MGREYRYWLDYAIQLCKCHYVWFCSLLVGLVQNSFQGALTDDTELSKSDDPKCTSLLCTPVWVVPLPIYDDRIHLKIAIEESPRVLYSAPLRYLASFKCCIFLAANLLNGWFHRMVFCWVLSILINWILLVTTLLMHILTVSGINSQESFIWYSFVRSMSKASEILHWYCVTTYKTLIPANHDHYACHH